MPFNEVVLEDKFWKPRLKTQMETLVPFALDKTIEAQRALEQTGHFLAGIKDQLPEPHRFQSSDLYKVMEGAAYLLHNQDNRELEKRMDDIIDIIAKAQKDDGYLYVAHITGTSKNHDHWGGGGMGDKPYSFVLHSHELYNMGHMYEGAIAYYQATGKDKWLKVAEKSAEHINKVFFEGDPNYNNGKPINQAPGHEELELALTKLYRVTGKQLYLDMAQKFLDIRGKTYVPEGEGVMSPSYAQQHMPVKDQRKAVGHAVRATYLYSGMADVGALKGVSDYNEALESIWHDIVDTKMSITGGLGAIHGIEGFGPEYVLPNKEAYNETCAAVGNVFFNYRMFLLTKDARYMDVAEVSLLNNSLAGVNIEGNKFFYVNPLEADGSTPFNQGRPGRSPWFHTACCPSNIARLMPQVSGMMYSHTEDEVYVTFYASSSTEVELADGKVKIEQKSEYPFDGKIDLVISPKNKQKFKLKLRIPTWARSDQFVPGELYHYMDEEETKWKLTVNGQRMDGTLEDGFVTIDREWGNGDKISLDLPMPIRFSQSIEQVAANNDRIAVTRGPLVYAAEGIDNQGQVQQFYFGSLPSISKVKEEIIQDGILKDVVKVKIPANKIDTEGGKDITMIPYYAWNNRDEGSMIVWIPTDKEQVQFSNNGIAIGGKYSEVKASSINKNGSLNAISDPRRPTSSEDSAIQPWISENGEKQWVEIRLKKPRPIRSIGVYWFADKHMNVDLPKSWDIQYKKDGKWIAMDIYVTDQYSKDKDQYNVVHPGADLVADEIRLNIVQEKEKFIGILDVDINFDDIH
ncbi:MAG: beta-L-arabinofuranosidase domain-containing protein [Bacteroidota bacterium]|nr:beta-L-arabinofuranosidase domain-containing protein [Bacteroidota bacterium]